METVLRRRMARAPPPTPVATGKGLRSAAVDDRVLTQYLEKSLRVPDLTLPKPYPYKSPISETLTKTINLSSLIAGEDASIGEMMTAAAEIGAFSIDAADFLAIEEVRALIEAGRELARSGEEKEMILEVGASEDTYRIFREKTEKVTCKLELVAESITKILSEHVKTQGHSGRIHKVHSVICLRKYGDSHQMSGDKTKDGYSHTLSLQITGSDHKFRIHSPDSTSFTLPSDSLLVTIGKQFEEFCNGELKCFSGEIFLEPSDEQLVPFSLEFMYSLPVLDRVPHYSSKIVSLMDQLLILLVLAFLYNLWN